MAYHEMTSYQWHDVTERPPTAIGETVTVIPISYACTAIFGLIPHLNIVSNGGAHILQYVGRTESTCKRQHKARELAVNTAKGISSSTLYGASTRIWLLHLAL